MAGVLIRAAEPADLDQVREVFRRAALSNDGDRAALLAHPDALELSGPASRVAVVEGRVVGFTTLVGAELEDLFVDPDWTGRGIGRALVVDAIAVARAEGLERIEVTANLHALGFYEKVGFVADGAAETSFGPAVRMQIEL
jgi:GNAT superfamily N-acetyltransferase